MVPLILVLKCLVSLSLVSSARLPPRFSQPILCTRNLHLRGGTERTAVKTERLVKFFLPLQESLSDVKIVGSWDDWKVHHPLQRNQEGFEASLSLEEGSYEFKFIMDGKWTTNEAWSLSKDEHGNANNVVIVTRTEDKTEDVQMPITHKAPRRLRCGLFAWESLHTVAAGGVAPHVTELAAGLERRGHEVHLFVRAAPGQDPYACVHGVHLHRIPYGKHGDIVKDCDVMCEQFFWLCQWLESFQKDFHFDILHAHDWLAAKVIVAAKQYPGRKHRAIVTMHSTEWGRCGQKYARWKCEGQSGHIREIERAACEAADRVICVSGVLEEEVRMLYDVPAYKTRTIYNAIHVCQYECVKVDPGEIKRQIGFDWYNPMILFVGRMVEQKGPDILLEAVPQILANNSEARIVFVGGGHMLPDLKQRALTLGVSHAVHFLGSASGDPLKMYEKACDILVVPSRNEPFGIVVLEGWACHKPVVATTSGGPREFLCSEREGILSDPVPENVSASVSLLLSNWTRLQEMGENGFQKCADQFNWDQIAQQTEEVYYAATG